MSYDSRIILGGQQFDLAGAMNAGREMAMQQKAFDQQNALAELYKTQGEGIMAGDPNALAALAQFDPGAALGLKQTQQQMTYSAEDQQRQREESRARAEAALADQAATLTQEQLAAEEKALTEVLSGAAFFYQNKDQAGYEAFLRSKGADPAEYPFEAFPAHAAAVEGVLDAFNAFAPPAGPEPLTQEAKLAADFKAGLIDQGAYEGGLARLAPKSTSLSVDPTTGAVTFRDGVAQSGTGEPTVGQVYNPNEVASVITMIDEIAANPNLERVVGPIEGGGGNNIDDLGMAARTYYGGEGTALVERIGQLQNNAWLSARQMLKGGGAITDYESRKAEGAVARLSRAKSEAEFKTALKDLRDAIVEGEKKLRGQRAAPAATPAPATGGDMSDDDLLKLYGGE